MRRLRGRPFTQQQWRAWVRARPHRRRRPSHCWLMRQLGKASTGHSRHQRHCPFIIHPRHRAAPVERSGRCTVAASATSRRRLCLAAEGGMCGALVDTRFLGRGSARRARRWAPADQTSSAQRGSSRTGSSSAVTPEAEAMRLPARVTEFPASTSLFVACPGHQRVLPRSHFCFLRNQCTGSCVGCHRWLGGRQPHRPRGL